MCQRIGLIAENTHNTQEMKILHNMLVCQVATLSPLCISMTLKECTSIDKHLLSAYKFRLNYMKVDAKHGIFLSSNQGGIGAHFFTQEYIGALLRGIEVYISNENTMTAHTLLSSIEESTKQSIWKLHHEDKLPEHSCAEIRAKCLYILGRKVLQYLEDPETPTLEVISFDHMHTMERAIRTTSYLGFILRDLKYEFCSRLIDELLLQDKKAKAMGSPCILTCATMGACIGEGNFTSTLSLDIHISYCK